VISISRRGQGEGEIALSPRSPAACARMVIGRYAILARQNPANYLPFFTERHGPGRVPESPYATTGTVPFRHPILLTASRLFDARILAWRHR